MGEMSVASSTGQGIHRGRGTPAAPPLAPGGQAGLAAIAIGIAVLTAATVAMARGVEPFATWYYPFAWFGVLLAGDGTVAWLGRNAPPDERGFLLLGRPAFLLTVLGWSAVAWLFFELLNFRLRNWYYVFLPGTTGLRWTGTILSFTTVLPAVFVSETLLSRLGVAREVRWPRFRVTSGVLRGIRIAGVLMLALPVLWPRYFFPLVWGAATLLIEPSTYRRAPDRSLLADLERGEPGRVLRLLLGGAFIGLLWEALNINARGKWIYTVPGLEQLKLFEMPLLGFLGFPPFALECFAIWQALVLGGVAVPRIGRVAPASVATRAGASVAAVAFSALVVMGMERFTFSSYTPRLANIPGLPATMLRDAGYNAFSLAGAQPESVGRAVGAGPERAAEWIEAARLAVLRGIGTENARDLMALGIRSVEELAAADASALAARLEALKGDSVVSARVRVWVRAARQALTEG